MNKIKSLVFAGVFFGLLWSGSTTLVWACKAMGPDKHVGMVQKVDLEAKTFSIIDAETRIEITFGASKKILDQIKVNTRVVVTYVLEGETLFAKDVKT
jgi:hypothetical protein